MSSLIAKAKAQKSIFLASIFLFLSSLFCLIKVAGTDFAYDWTRYKTIVLWAIVFFVTAYGLKKKNKEPLLLLVPLAFFFLSQNLAGLFGFILFFFMSYVVGAWFNSKFSMLGEHLSFLEQTLLKYFIGHLLVTEFFLFLIHLPINYYPVYLAITFAAIFFGRSYLNSLQLDIRKKPISLSWLSIICLFFTTVFLVFYLLPVYVFEDINAYLYIPKLIIQNGVFWPNVEFVSSFSVVSTYALYTVNMMLGGEYAVRTLLFFHLGATLFLLGHFLKRYFSMGASIVGVLSLATIPIMYFTAAGFFNDSLDLFLGISFFIIFYEVFKENRILRGSWILGFFILVACAFPIRNQSFVIIFPISLVLFTQALLRIKRQRDYSSFRYFLLGSTIFVGLSSLWLYRNYWISGNPMLPFFNKFFKSPYFYDNWDVLTDSLGSIPGLSPRLIYDLTFHFDLKYLYNGFHRFGFGFTYFSFSIAALFIFFNESFRKRYKVVIFLCLASFVCYHVIFVQARYIYSALPLYCFFIAAIYFHLERTYKKIAVFSVTLIFGMNLFFQQQGKEIVTYPFPLKEILFNSHQLLEVVKWDEVKKFFSVANVLVGKNEKILMHYSQGNYFANFHVSGLDWYFYPVESQIRKAAKESKEDPLVIYDLIFKGMNFDGMILTYEDFYHFQKLGLIEKVFSWAGHTLYRPTQNFKFDEWHSLSQGSLGLNILGSGWNSSEPTGVWSTSESWLNIKLPRYKQTQFYIELELFPLVTAGKFQRLIISTGNSKQQYTISGPEVVKFKISEHDNSGFVQIKIECPDATSPAVIGIDPKDRRSLGVHVQKIKVSKN